MVLFREMENDEIVDFYMNWFEGLLDLIMFFGDGWILEIVFEIIFVNEEYVLIFVFGFELKG